jgi:hypothetical protein
VGRLPAVAVALTSRGMVAEVVDEVTAKLVATGFARRQVNGIFTLDVSPEVIGWLGLNTATKHLAGSLEVNPVVGVRHQGVERRVAELRNERFHRFLPPTVSGSLGYLMPERSYVGWHFEKGSVVESAANLASAVERFALPEMRSTIDLMTLRRKIEEGWGYEHQLVYRLPVVCWMQGDVQGAVEAMERAVTELGDRTDDAADEFRAFADRFRAFINGGR